MGKGRTRYAIFEDEGKWLETQCTQTLKGARSLIRPTRMWSPRAEPLLAFRSLLPVREGT